MTCFAEIVLAVPAESLAMVKLVDELGLGFAVVLTIVGMAMHWQLPGHRMSMEERAKDGKMTEDEAHRRVASFQRLALVTTVTGVVVLAVVLLQFAN